MPLRELLDPQGKAVMTGLGNLGFKNVDNVRIGKNISLEVEAASKEEARKIAEEASKKLGFCYIRWRSLVFRLAVDIDSGIYLGWG